MKVRLIRTWFSPTEVTKKYPKNDGTSDYMVHVSGQRYKAGVQDIPVELRDSLPSDAVILEDDYYEAPTPVVQETALDYDHGRAESDRIAEINTEVDKKLAKANKTAK